jgi:hypothetical protein
LKLPWKAELVHIIKNGSDSTIYVPWWKDIVRADRILNYVSNKQQLQRTAKNILAI